MKKTKYLLMYDEEYEEFMTYRYIRRNEWMWFYTLDHEWYESQFMTPLKVPGYILIMEWYE
jgi:hypothetical protein